MVTITAAELQKQFGRYREIAIREPVAVTHHGRDSLVVLSADEYKRLKSMDDRRAYFANELPEELIQALETTTPPARSTVAEIRSIPEDATGPRKGLGTLLKEFGEKYGPIEFERDQTPARAAEFE